MIAIVAFDLIEKKLLEMSFRDNFDHDHTYCDFYVFREFLNIWVMGMIHLKYW